MLKFAFTSQTLYWFPKFQTDMTSALEVFHFENGSSIPTELWLGNPSYCGTLRTNTTWGQKIGWRRMYFWSDHISLHCYPTTLHTAPAKTEALILWDMLFYSPLKEVSVLWYQRPCQNPLLLAVVLKSVDANILLQRWKQMRIPQWRNPWRNHDNYRFFGYWIRRQANLFSDRSKHFLPNGTQRERERGANTSWETGGLNVITNTTTLLARQRPPHEHKRSGLLFTQVPSTRDLTA